MGGNSTHHYERHEDDEQQQRITIQRDFRLIFGQLDFASEANQRKRLSFPTPKKQPRHRKISSSTDQQSSTVSLIIVDIPTSPFDTNDLDIHTFRQILLDQDVYGKELSHLFRIPSNQTQRASLLKTLPTVKLAAIYYEQGAASNDLFIDALPYVDETDLDGKFDQFKEKTILSTYTSKSHIHLISTKNPSKNSQYICVRSTTMCKTAVENFDWFQVLIDYSRRGYRLCGVIPLPNKSSENSLIIYWLFERMEKVQYECSILEYQWKSSTVPWTPLLNWMSKQEWKLVSTLEYQCKKKTGDISSSLLFFQKCKY